MRKFLSMMAIVALTLSMASCGDDENDEIVFQHEWEKQWVSTETGENVPTFYFDLRHPGTESPVTLQHVQFKIGERVSPPMNIKIKAPLSKKGNIYTFSGTDLIPFMLVGDNEVPADKFIVTDYVATVNVKAETYSISFKCHGGEFNSSGKCTNTLSN